ncbi:MAG: hypothetical protein ACREEM_25755 [Blastocatellia bacterium]
MRKKLFKFAFFALLCIAAFSGCSNNASPPTSSSHSPINTPGQRVELRSHLAAGKTNIFYFYADW